MDLQPLPDEKAFVSRWAATVGIDLPAACVEGVAANLALLAEHASRLDDFALPDEA